MTMRQQSANIPIMTMQPHPEQALGETSMMGCESLPASADSLRRAVLWLGGGSFALFGLAGGLLWWRDGERLFTEGLISAIARCF